MGSMFFWRQNPPGTGQISVEKWTQFLDSMASISLLIIAVTVLIIVAGYSYSAANRKVRQPEDVFATYTPMFWLFVALLAALAAGGICWWQYGDALGENAPGVEAFAFEIALWTGLWSFLLAYAVMLVPGVTPQKFRYRPRWLFYRHKGARS